VVFLAYVLLLGLVGILTAAEMATFSARQERMVQVTNGGDRRGTVVLAYQRSPVSFLSAAQWLATAATFAIGSMNSSHLQPLAESWLTDLGLQPRHADLAAFSGILVVVTIISLIFTNVAPKQWAFVHANEFAVTVAMPMRWLIQILAPISWVVAASSAGLLRLVNVKKSTPPAITEADIKTMIGQGQRSGDIEAREGDIVRRALELSDIGVADAMTPRDRIQWVDSSWTKPEIDLKIKESGRSLLPVCRGSLDRCEGIIRTRDWLATPD